MNKGETTRQRIIAEAAPIFNQRGFNGCSMQDILDATGLEKGGVYRHFSSKEELALEAFRYALDTAVKVRTDNLEEIDSAVGKLRYVVRRFVEEPSSIPGGCPLMNTAIDSDDGNPALRRLARKGLQDWKARLCRIVEDGIKRGEIRTGVEPRTIANTIVATLEGSLMISRMEDSGQAMQDAQESLNILISEIEPPHSASPAPQVSNLRPGIQTLAEKRSRAKKQ